jgi:hypothetical protein
MMPVLADQIVHDFLPLSSTRNSFPGFFLILQDSNGMLRKTH